jgi:uncharacterized phiE125 gp8 family phage protein
MILTEISTPPAAAYPVRALADHLRLGTGFADDGSQDAILEAYLRAAMAAIEGRTGKAILERTLEWELGRWSDSERQGLPVAPVGAILSVTLVTSDGVAMPVDPARYRLERDQHRPRLAGATMLPTIPAFGFARVVLTAGYGADWDDVPADLRQAVLLLAAYYYDNRAQVEGSGTGMPFGVLALIERYRVVRLMGDPL